MMDMISPLNKTQKRVHTRVNAARMSARATTRHSSTYGYRPWLGLVKRIENYRENVARGVLSEDAVNVSVTWDYVAVVEARAVRLAQQVVSDARTLGLETLVIRAVN